MKRRVTLYLTFDEAIKLKQVGLTDAKAIKEYLVSKLREDMRTGLVVEMIEQIKAENERLKKMVLELANQFEKIERLEEKFEEKASGNKDIALLILIKEMFKVLITYQSQLYKEEIRQKALKELDEILRRYEDEIQRS